jgi:hypothetical protein
MTIALTTIGGRGVTLTVEPPALREATEEVAIELTLNDGPLVLTLTRNETQPIAADITTQLAETGKAT